MKKQILFLALFLATTTIMAQETVASWDFNPTFQLTVSSITENTYPTVELPLQVLIEGPINQSLSYTLQYGEQLNGEWIGSPNILDIDTNNFDETVMFAFTNNEVYGSRTVVFELIDNFNQTIIQELTFDVLDPSQVLSELAVFYIGIQNGLYTYEVENFFMTPNLLNNITSVLSGEMRLEGTLLNPVSVEVGGDNNGNPLVNSTTLIFKFSEQPFELFENFETNLEIRIQDHLEFWTNWVEVEYVQ